jgi:peptidyl-dipeptidase A
LDSVQATVTQREEALSRFIEDLVREVEPLHCRHNEAVWRANTTGEARYAEEGARLDTQIRTIFSRPEPYQRLRNLAHLGGVDEPMLQRQLRLLLNDYRAHQIPPARIEEMVRLEKALESRFNNFRASLGDRQVSDNQLREILRNSTDGEERRSAWEAAKQIGGEVAGDLVRLVGLRNQAARDLGFDNYYSMMLELDELDEAELFRLMDDLDLGTRPLFQRYKRELDLRLARRFRCGAQELRPWHYSDPFFQEAPGADVALDPYFEGRSLEDLTARFFGALGFEIRELLDRSDLYERAGKSQHAFCLSMDRGKDVRVLCNVRANEYWMSTMLHEFGHAVYDRTVDPGLPYLLRIPAHILTTEAAAMLFGRLSKNAAWLIRYAQAPADQARVAAAALANATRAQLLVQTRWCLVMCHMERALYRDPDQDLTSLWWELVGEFQELRRPEGRAGSDWASKIHFSVAPVYYQNYMLGEMMASQVQAHLLAEVIGGGEGDPWGRYVSDPEVGAFLRERLFRRGKSMDWREAIRAVTGRPLEPTAFVAELAGTS